MFMWTSNLSSVTPSRIYLMEYSKSPLKFIFRFKNFLETSSCALKKLYKLSPVLILSWYILPFTKWILSLFFWRTSLPYFDARYSKNSSLLLLRTPTFYTRVILIIFFLFLHQKKISTDLVIFLCLVL